MRKQSGSKPATSCPIAYPPSDNCRFPLSPTPYFRDIPGFSLISPFFSQNTTKNSFILVVRLNTICRCMYMYMKILNASIYMILHDLYISRWVRSMRAFQ